MLTPVNYFDYDVSMESRNAILIHELKEQGGVREFDDYGVKENFHCLPDAPPDFEYSEIGVVGEDGETFRQRQEMFIRLKES